MAVKEERRTFVASAIAVVLVVILAGVVSLSLYRRGHAENVRVYAAISRLQTGTLSQLSLLESSRPAHAHEMASTNAMSGPPESQAADRGDRSGTAGDQADDTAALKSQVATVEGRLDKLENQGNVAHKIIDTY